MVTSKHNVTCPNCNSINSYEIQKLDLIDNELLATYVCECGCRYTDTYALVYLGGYTDNTMYDRDNLIVNR